MSEIIEVFGWPSQSAAQSKLDFLVALEGGEGRVFKSDRGWTYRWYEDGMPTSAPATNSALTDSPVMADGPVDTSSFDLGGLRNFFDFIAEFESGDNYNAYYLHANNSTNPTLTSMTLSEVRNFQDKLIAKGFASSASGRYQIIRKTLDGLIVSLGLSSASISFDQSTQDTMALKLAEGRGIKKYIQGTMTTEAFAREIAKEWASMPVLEDTIGHVRPVKAGQSYYAGDGLNAAHASAHDFRARIEALRA